MWDDVTRPLAGGGPEAFDRSGALGGRLELAIEGTTKLDRARVPSLLRHSARRDRRAAVAANLGGATVTYAAAVSVRTAPFMTDASNP